ncbi:MAG: hypothetical protein ACRC6A_02805, partial [Fusobacteriaceae bacterium]
MGYVGIDMEESVALSWISNHTTIDEEFDDVVRRDELIGLSNEKADITYVDVMLSAKVDNGYLDVELAGIESEFGAVAHAIDKVKADLVVTDSQFTSISDGNFPIHASSVGSDVIYSSSQFIPSSDVIKSNILLLSPTVDNATVSLPNISRFYTDPLP